jgi:hypothetical protein
VVHMPRTIMIAVGLMLTGGCWNGDNDTISLGSVSIGQQMIDLQAALEQDAISQAEYDRLKSALMSIDGICDNTHEE